MDSRIDERLYYDSGYHWPMMVISDVRSAGAEISYFSVAAMRRISAGGCSPASAVPGMRCLPIASPPIGTGS